MREKLIHYVELLFAGTPHAEDIRQEILQNTLDRYDDLIDQGKSPEAAYQLAICGIGDLSELLTATSEPGDNTTAPLPTQSPEPVKRRRYTAVAVMLYILCVVPVILFGQMGLPTLGICTMFLMIAAATGLLILQGKDDKADDERESRSPKSELDKSIDTLVGVVGVIVYLAVSFATSAWYITWVIFPIMAAVKGLIRAILDLKEATK